MGAPSAGPVVLKQSPRRVERRQLDLEPGIVEEHKVRRVQLRDLRGGQGLGEGCVCGSWGVWVAGGVWVMGCVGGGCVWVMGCGGTVFARGL